MSTICTQFRDDPFFVVGAGRSGTTLLRMILTGHPRITIPPETWFIVPLVERFPLDRQLSREEIWSAVNMITSHPRWVDQNIPNAEYIRAVQGLKGAKLADVINVVYSYQIIREGKKRIGDKTPPYIEIVPQLTVLFPDSKFINMLRDGRDVAESFVHAGFHGRAYHGKRFEWSCAVRRREALRKLEFSNRILDVRFEELIERPDDTLRTVCAFLGESYESTMLDWHDRLHLIPARERAIHTGLFFPISQFASQSRKPLPALKSLFVEAALSNELDLAGYHLRYSGKVWRPILAVVKFMEVQLSPFLDRLLPFLSRRSIVSFQSVIALAIRKMPQWAQWRLMRLYQKRIRNDIVTIATSDGFRMRLSTNDFVQRQIFLSGTWSPEICRIIRLLRKGDLFVDVGANVGFFSLLAAHREADVVAFEPNPVCFSALERNIKLNRMTSIDSRPIALGVEPGHAQITIPTIDNLGSGTLIKSVSGIKFNVRLDSLDAQLAGRIPKLIKIDVEGAEAMVLYGAAKTLQGDSAPDVICEISEYSLFQLGSSKKEIIEFMVGLGYQARLISPVRQSQTDQTSVYLQYDVLFSKNPRG